MPVTQLIPLRAQRFTIRVALPGTLRKILRLGFAGSDGSVWIAFPYFQQARGVVGVVSHPPLTGPLKVNLGEKGKVTSHLVKYDHHRSGLALFSQTGKVASEIRKQSVPLSVASGHLCTIHVDRLAAFDEDETARPDQWTSGDCAPLSDHTVTFDATNSEFGAMKFVIRCYNKRRLREMVTGRTAGPVLNIEGSSLGRTGRGVLLAAPKATPGSATYLVIEGQHIPDFTQPPRPSLVFIGGFDPPEIAGDPTKPTSFLALAYPVDRYEELRTKVGTIDLPRELGRARLASRGNSAAPGGRNLG